MAKVIVAWCDPCMNNDVQTPAKPFVITLGTGKPVELDLCETHDKELLNPLRELMGEMGQPVGAEPASPSTTAYGSPKKPCPTCGKALSREGMRRHAQTFHDANRMQAGNIVREVFGAPPQTSSGQEHPCEECKAEGLPKEEYTFDTPQGLGAHRRSQHGVEGAKRRENAA